MPQVGFHALDKAKQQEFTEQLKLRGLDPKQVIGVHLDSNNANGRLQLHTDLTTSHVVAHHRTVYSIADLKRVSGVPDSAVAARAQDLTEYPDEPSFDVPKLATRYSDPRALSRVLGPEGNATVKKAAAAYLSGNSKRVTELGYEPLINALYFPLVTATSAVDTITVQNGQTVAFGKPGDPPHDTLVTTITMIGSGSLQFLSDYTINCTGTMSQQ
jgi:hypothetical protein